MSSENIAIQVQNVSKCFEMYKTPAHRLKQMVYPRFLSSIRRNSKIYYDEFWALQNINFEVERGQTVGIMGQNGSGKSTLLQIITGTLSPTTGNVNVNGRVAALLELGSGFNPDFSGVENVYLNASLLGLSRQETDKKLDEILAFADIGAHVEQPVKTYSSGMMLRLAFAVQAAVETEVLIIDEALAVGDARFQLKCFRRLQEIKDNGTTILFVSHATELVRSFCEIGIFLDKGQVKYIGDANTATIQYFSLLFPNQGNAENDLTSIEASSEANLNVEIPPVEKEKNILYYDNFCETSPNNFGHGGAKLHWLEIEGLENSIIFSGGEEVTIRGSFSWDKELAQELIISKNLENNIALCIALMDSQGRYIFGCNGFDYKIVLDCLSNENSIAEFQLKLPFLVTGTYFMTVAITVGSLPNHEQLRWYDALIELKCVQKETNVFGTFKIDYAMHYNSPKEKCA